MSDDAKHAAFAAVVAAGDAMYQYIYDTDLGERDDQRDLVVDTWRRARVLARDMGVHVA